MDSLPFFIRDHADVQLLSWDRQIEAATCFGVTLAQVEEIALERGILPARYQRNRQAISVSDQLTIFRSCVCVVGCGGLGCYVIEELARLGVGKIVVIDPDVFEEHNLNRQLFSTPANLGTAKVNAAASRIGEINPAVTLIPVQTALSLENGASLLDGCQIVVDALDSIKVRLELAAVCTSKSIPLVHGAIAGWFGHVATQFPGDATLQTIYQTWESGEGVEQRLGNPSFTPALVASLEVAEVCKILLGQGTPLRGRQLIIDLFSMDIQVVTLFNDNEGEK
jgi:molybdopterin/thiamine biosynthesis adenylyltransferase